MTLNDKYERLSNSQKQRVNELLSQLKIAESKEHLLNFTNYTFKKFKAADFHKEYYNILQKFANQEIKNLIISMPPQHGKSEGSSRRLPAYIAGSRPDMKIALVCYAATKAQKFGREIMSIMREREYKNTFPDVEYPERGYTGTKANTNENRESINSDGSMKFVGVGGALTGDPVDVLILDDLYKDWQEANSPIIQQRVWDWYLAVAESRLHNDSQQLIVFTRWSENDLIAILETKGKVIEWNGDEDIDTFLSKITPDQFVKINFEAIKESEPTQIDPRAKGQSLWESKHSLRKLINTRELDPDKFDCLYQGNPQNKEGMLYSDFKTYSELPAIKAIKNYTDTADTGTDYLCSINYAIPLAKTDEHIYVTDVLFSQQPMEKTEPLTSNLILSGNVKESKIESNNGGRGFARNVQNLVGRKAKIKWFHQSSNKEARIYSNSASVSRLIVFPIDWHIRFPDFYQAVTKYKKVFAANKYDDAPDVLTGIIETEVNSSNDDWGGSRVL